MFVERSLDGTKALIWLARIAIIDIFLIDKPLIFFAFLQSAAGAF